MASFFEHILSSPGRAPAAIADRLVRAAMALFHRRRNRRKRIDLALSAFRNNNRLRSDVGLPPVDPAGRPL